MSKKWTDEKITETIIELMNKLSIETFPTNMQMRENKLSGLSRAIGLSGGVEHWSKKTGIPRKQREVKWTDELIKKEIKKSMDVLCINRMPSASELTSIGRNDLHCAISKGLTYYGWAKEMGLNLKSSETLKGNKYEEIAKRKLQRRGYTVEKMTTKHPYDLLVNENVKVDIKVGRVHYHFGSKAHTFRLAKKYSTCDIYICFALDKDSNTENIFIIPSKFAKVETMNVGTISKYNKFIDRWDFLDDYTTFYKSITI